MQAVPLLARQSLRSSIGLSRTPVALRSPANAFSRPLALHRRTQPLSSPCLRCQFRSQLRFYTTEGQPKDGTKDGAQDGIKDEVRDQQGANETRNKVDGEGTSSPESSTSEPERGTFEKFGARLNWDTSNLPSFVEQKRSKFSKKFTILMDNLQSNVFIAGQRLNVLTGYSAIESLKNEILSQEAQVRQSRAHVREAKEAYTAAISRRSASQREVNELLQRKHAWSTTDLERFTELYRSDHANEVSEVETQEALGAAEREAEEAAAKLNRTILARYHEEQIWSDKIRRMSTWGTWGLMGVNVLLFLIFQVAVEPWRRQRLVKGFEEKVLDALEKENEKLHVTVASSEPKSLEEGSIVPSAPLPATSTATLEQGPAAVQSYSADAEVEQAETETSSPAASSTDDGISEPEDIVPTRERPAQHVDSWMVQQPLSAPEISFSAEAWGESIRYLFGEQRIAITQRDLTTMALQSAAAGAAVMGLLIAICRPR